MKLAGDISEFSLPDLIQVHAPSGKSGCIRVLTPRGKGKIFIDGKTIVHADYGELTGRSALFALLAQEEGYFEVESGGTAPQRTIAESLPSLLMEARGRRETGEIELPKQIDHKSATFEAEFAAAEQAAAEAQKKPSLALRVAAVLLPLVIVSALWFGRDAFSGLGSTRVVAAAASGAVPADAGPGKADSRPARAVPVVEAPDLTGEGDRPPELLQGEAPASPRPGLGLTPTIVCRILVDQHGAVEQATVYRSRLDLADFEDAALEAVEGYTFRPGLQAGEPVRVWINWPVNFR